MADINPPPTGRRSVTRSRRRVQQTPRSLLFAIRQVLRDLRHAQEQLESRSGAQRRDAKAAVGFAIEDLQRAIDAGIEAATRDLAEDLKIALGPDFTVGEFAGARTVLELILANLPARIGEGRL
jgi:hypothetical protein